MLRKNSHLCLGKTERTLCERMKEHLGYIRNKHFNQATVEHFHSHGLKDPPSQSLNHRKGVLTWTISDRDL